MSELDDRERDCLARYCALLRDRLGDDLAEVAVPEPVRDALLDETYPLFLECGRQLSPHFFSERRLAEGAMEDVPILLEMAGARR